MTCKCVPCSSCNGSGHVWYSFSGEYLGNSRCDDLDDLESCDDCGGSGIAEECDECLEYWREEEERQYEEEMKRCNCCGRST